MSEQGPKGDTGEPGRSLTVFQGIAIFILIAILGFGLTAALHRSQVASCRQGIEIVQHFNEQQEKLAAIEEKYPSGTPEAAAKAIERAKVYREGMVPLPKCSR